MKKVDTFWVPLYENADLNDCYSVENLMDLFVYEGERCYYSLSINASSVILIKATSVETMVENEELKICFHFADCFEYKPEREFLIGEDGDYTEDEVKMIIDACHKAVGHLFFLRNKKLTSKDLKFEYEYWG